VAKAIVSVKPVTAMASGTAIFFMAISPFLLEGRLPHQGKDFRDGHHVLKLFGGFRATSTHLRKRAEAPNGLRAVRRGLCLCSN
jgi:hypothetical protein